MKKTLKEKALSRKMSRHYKSKDFSKETLDLAMAYFKDEVTSTQYAYALDKKAPTGLYHHAYSILLAARRRGEIKLVKSRRTR